MKRPGWCSRGLLLSSWLSSVRQSIWGCVVEWSKEIWKCWIIFHVTWVVACCGGTTGSCNLIMYVERPPKQFETCTPIEKSENWHHCFDFHSVAFVYAWGTFLLIACNSNRNNVGLLNDTWNQDCVKQRRWCHLNRLVVLKSACVSFMYLQAVHIIKHSSQLKVRRRGAVAQAKAAVFAAAPPKAAVQTPFPPWIEFIPCIPTVLEHFVAVWSPHHSGEDWESFQWALPHSSPSSFPCVHF